MRRKRIGKTDKSILDECAPKDDEDGGRKIDC
jgi:hypothetical protein